MEENKNVQEEQISYDELAKNFISLRNNYFEAVKRLHEYEKSNFFTQLGFLIEIVKIADKFPSEFTEKCVNEIIAMMTPEVPNTEELNEQEG